MPLEDLHRNIEPNRTAKDDEENSEDEDERSIETDLNGVKEHMRSFPSVSDILEAFEELFADLDTLLGDGKLMRGHWPTKIIVANTTLRFVPRIYQIASRKVGRDVSAPNLAKAIPDFPSISQALSNLKRS